MKNVNLEVNKNIKDKGNDLGVKFKKIVAVGLVSVNLLLVGAASVLATPYLKWTEEQMQKLREYADQHKDYDGRVTWNKNELKRWFPDRDLRSIQEKYYNDIKPDDEKHKNLDWTSKERQKLREYADQHKDYDGRVTWNKNELKRWFPDRDLRSIQEKYHNNIKPDDEKKKLTQYIDSLENKSEIKWDFIMDFE